jgi:hypothetical protein
MKTVEIGNQKQFFVDDYIVEGLSGLERVLHEAQRAPESPVLWGEHAWEKWGTWIYGSVFQDESSGQLRMWYQTNAGSPEGALVCYATSEDGLSWHKPELGVVAFRGSRANNIVWATGYSDAYCPSVIYDPRDPDPQRRYKLYTWDVQTLRGYPQPGRLVPSGGHDEAAPSQRGMWLATSPDGIHFTQHGEMPLITEIGDVLPTIYDEQLERYVSFTKINEVRPGDDLYRRSVGMSTSPDGLRWTEPRLILTQDELDDVQTRNMGGERTEFYGLSGFPYEGMYFGFLWVFHIMRFKMRPDRGRGWDDGPLDIQLVYSRDGATWHRPFSREPVLPVRPVGNFDHSVGAAANRPLLTDNEILIYYTGASQTHGVDFPKAYMAIGLARLRRDGFVSVACGPDEGTLLTRPFRITGSRLALNLDAHRGYARVALVRPDGTDVEGYRAEDCDVMVGDSVRQVVSWQSSADLGALRGQVVRMRVHLKHANFYTFQVVA